MPPTDPQRAATVDGRTSLKRVGVGPQTYGAWTNAALHDLARQIEREVDDGKRKTYFGIHDVVRWDNGWMGS